MREAMSNHAIFTELAQLDFVQRYIHEYADALPFNESTLVVEHQDCFGQCSVWLGFTDEFAIRDAFGQWRAASAEECCQLAQGLLPGALRLM